MTDIARLAQGPRDAAEHLAFAHHLIELFPAADPRRRHWRDRVARVHDRMADHTYRLAVIGEFSSGKTTFINAMLRDDLFATSAIPTTAATVRISHGPALAVRAVFRDGGVWSSADPANGRAATAARRRPATALAGMPPKAALQQLTTGAELAAQVAVVDVSHPAPILRDGLVIVDTPGTNADAGHSEIARRAVLDADAAVVVLTAARVLPASLGDFLTMTLDAHLLARCAYVVTRVDEVDDDEHRRVWDTACGRIQRMLRIAEPDVALCAPGAVIRELRGAPAEASQTHWAQRFEGTAGWLMHHVTSRRPVAVVDTTLRLVDDLFADLDNALAAEREDLRQQEAALGTATLADLDGFLRDQARAGGQVLREARPAAHAAAVRRHEQELAATRAAIRTAIDGCATNTALAGVLRDTVPALVRSRLDGLAQAVATELRGALTAKLDAATAVVQNAFNQEYERLERAGQPHVAAPAVARISADELVLTNTFSAAVAVATADESRENKAFGWGAASGAAIGTMIAPGLGTIIGGAIGFIAGGLFTRSLDEVKAEAKVSAVGTADAIFGQVRQRLSNAVEHVAARTDQAFHEHLDWYRTSYRHTVDTIRAEHAAHRAELRGRAERLEQARAGTTARRRALEARRAQLSAYGSTGFHGHHPDRQPQPRRTPR